MVEAFFVHYRLRGRSGEDLTLLVRNKAATECIKSEQLVYKRTVFAKLISTG